MTEKKEKTWILPVTLGLVSLIMAFLICGVYVITKDTIDARALEAQEAAKRSVLPAAVTLEDLPLVEGAAVDYCCAGYDSAGNVIGYVSQITVVGFGGTIEVTVGMDMTGTITAISVGGADFSETSGLGAKTKEPAFTSQFAGKSGTLVLKQNIDSVTGASVSSGAVVGGVNQAVAFMTAYLTGDTSVTELPLSAEELALLLPGDSVTFMGSGSGVDGWWQGTTGYIVQATGYGHGPIVVKMSFNAEGVCLGIVIGDDSFSESEGYGARVLEPEFWQQFIGKSGVQSFGAGVDAVSGATSTSNGALAAINACMSFTPSAARTAAPVVPEVQTASSEAEASADAVSAASTAAETSGEAVTAVPTATPAPTPATTPGTAPSSAEASAEAVIQTPVTSGEAESADAVSSASETEEVLPAETPVPTPAPTPDAVSEASETEEALPAATPVPTPAPTPEPVPDAVSEASVTEE